jgi:hypothetical protein
MLKKNIEGNDEASLRQAAPSTGRARHRHGKSARKSRKKHRSAHRPLTQRASAPSPESQHRRRRGRCPRLKPPRSRRRSQRH